MAKETRRGLKVLVSPPDVQHRVDSRHKTIAKMHAKADTISDPERKALFTAIYILRGRDLSSVSQEIGRNHAYLHQYIFRHSPQDLSDNDRRAILTELNLSEGQIWPERTRERKFIESGLESQEFERVSVFGLKPSAGFGNFIDDVNILYDIVFRHEWLSSITNARPEQLAVFEVDGSSMEPTLHHQDHVLCDLTQNQADRDGIFVLVSPTETTLLVKRLTINPASGFVSVRSDNPLHDEYPDIDPADLKVFGRVIWLDRRV